MIGTVEEFSPLVVNSSGDGSHGGRDLWLDENAGKLVERYIFLRDLLVLRRTEGE